jgi:hypothetical protein
MTTITFGGRLASAAELLEIQAAVVMMTVSSHAQQTRIRFGMIRKALRSLPGSADPTGRQDG